MLHKKGKKFAAILLAGTLSIPFDFFATLAEETDTLPPTSSSTATTDTTNTDTEGNSATADSTATQDTSKTPEADANSNKNTTDQNDTVDFDNAGTSTEEIAEIENSEDEVSKEEDETLEEEETTTIVYSWSYIDEEEMLVYYEDQYVLDLPGASEDNPATKEDIAYFLPAQINAQTDTGVETLEITWDLSELPESAYEGTYNVHAILPEFYVLNTDADTLDVVVNLGGVEIYSTTSSITSSHLIQGVTPRGITMNLFDYWLSDEVPSDPTAGDGDKSNYTTTGINNNGTSSGRTLKFVASDIGTKGQSLNAWTGGSAPYTGIVANTLGDDGYPYLSGTSKANNSTESLNYLFDESDTNSGTLGKHAYMGVTNLLQIDSDGYYYYKASKGDSSSSDSWQSRDGNFASFDEETNSFKLYDEYGVYYTTNLADHTIGSFFPFNTAEQVFSGEDSNGNLQLDTSINPTSSTMNHYFGLTMTTKFIQQNGGYATDKTTPITYEFSGDDDIWVFIDGVLVADLGGMHDAASLKIDFSTGAIYINGTQNGTLLSKYTAAGKQSTVAWNGNTFADNTYHTLNFYYLERGGGGSNMALKFNLVTVPETEVDKIDQMGNAVPGATFNLYACDEKGNKTNTTPLATGTTDSDGVFVLQDTTGKILRLNELKEENYNYLLLEESSVPEGYRKSQDLILQIVQLTNTNILNDSSYTLKCINSSSSGGYSTSRVLITAPDNVYYADAPNGSTIDYKNQGTLFPVIMKYTGTSQDETALATASNWIPVTGSQVDGWNTKDSCSCENIIAAAQETGLEFDLTSSGSYQVQINDLPGDIQNYYLMHTEDTTAEVEYAIALYYTTADSLDGATSSNTKMVYDPVISNNTSNSFTRQLSSKIYVPNISNTFYVQKMDEDDNVLDVSTYGSATFTLYSDKDCTTAVYTRSTSDTNDLNLDGLATFTKLKNGTYYLKEDSAPNGFDVSEQVVTVVVNDSGVFVNAGSENDGVKVELGPGVVLKSLETFADGTLDYTLQDIIATMSTSTDLNTWTNTGKVMHLTYGNSSKLLEYGIDQQSVDVEWPGGFTVDTGYAKLNISQWYDDTHNTDKVELTGDISNLFATSTVVQIQNTPTPASTKLIKTDQNGEPVANAEFNLYSYNHSTKTKGNAVIATGITGEDGITKLVDTKGNELKLSDLYPTYNYLYLEETVIPDGYQKTNDAILRLTPIYDENNDVSVVTVTIENILDSGVISTKRVKITAPKQVYSDSEMSAKVDISNGLLIPVPMKKAESGEWVAIYGSSFDGWTETTDIITAVKETGVFFNSTGQGTVAEIDDLPGNLNKYQTINSTNCEYRIDYYYSTATSLSDVTDDNTVRVFGKFTEGYGSSIYVPNVSNTLIVQKLDENGEPISNSSAEFTLYASDQTTVVATAATGTSLDLDMKAVAIFNGLSEGTYYLKETTAPSGYKASDSMIPITVTADGIEAEVDSQDVDVEYQTGVLVSTMKQYSTNSNLNSRLYAKNTIVKVENEEQSVIDPTENSLTIYKKVKDGDEITDDVEFLFTITMKSMQLQSTTSYFNTRYQNYRMVNTTGEVPYVKSDGTTGNLTFNDGSATFTLKNGEWIRFTECVVTLSPTFTYYSNNGKQRTGYNQVYSGDWRGNPQYSQINTTTSYYNEWTVVENHTGNYAFVTNDYSTSIESSDDSVTITQPYDSAGTVTNEGQSISYVNTLNTKDFEFIKTDQNDEPLSGATFGLYELICTDDSHDHNNSTIYVDETGAIVSTSDRECWELVITSTSKEESGRVTFNKLIPGRTYRLVEIKPPQNYSKPTGQWIVTEGSSGTFNVSGSIGNPPAFQENQNGSYSVRNYLDKDLPLSGGEGIKKFLIVGIVLMIIGIFWIMKNANSKNDSNDTDNKNRTDRENEKEKIPIHKKE